MARRAADVLRATGADDGKGLAAWQRRVYAVGIAVVEAQPAMASMLTLVDAVFRAAERVREPGQGMETVGRVVARRADELAAAPGKAAARVPRLLPAGARVVTLSSSEMTWRALLAARDAGKLGSIVVADSVPGAEGRSTARRLAAAGIDVTLVPDALAPGMVAAADAVIVGADAITPRTLWNKCGTLGVALAARGGRRPLLVVTGTDRMIGPVLAKRLGNVEVTWARGAARAALFEPVPLRLVSQVVSERGAVRADVVARRLARVTAARWWTRPPA